MYVCTHINSEHIDSVTIPAVQEIIKLTFDCRIMPVMSGVKRPLLLKITPVAHFARIQQNYGCTILYDTS